MSAIISTRLTSPAMRTRFSDRMTVMEWIRKNERDYAFLGVKFMRDRIFKNDAAARAALQFGIDVGMLELYKVENPENPDWKTTACRLDRGHSIVQALLADAEIGNER